MLIQGPGLPAGRQGRGFRAFYPHLERHTPLSRKEIFAKALRLAEINEEEFMVEMAQAKIREREHVEMGFQYVV